MQQRFLLQILLLAQHVSGHLYAHHQELKSIIQWLLPVVFRAVKLQMVICKLGGICVLSIKRRVLSGFVIRCVKCHWGPFVGVLGMFFVV